MTSTPSQCRQKISWKHIVIFAAAIFSLSVIGFWIVFIKEKNQTVALLGAGYALFCASFLVAQLIAFVKAHMDYDKTIEQPKYEMLIKEEMEWQDSQNF